MLRQVFRGAGRIGEPARTSSTRVGLVGSAVLHLAVLLLLLGLPHPPPEAEGPPETTVAMMFQGPTRAGQPNPNRAETPAPTRAEGSATEPPRPLEAVPPAPPPSAKALPPTPVPPLPMPPKPVPTPSESVAVAPPRATPTPPAPTSPAPTPPAPPAPAPAPTPKVEQALPLPLPPPVPPPPNPGATAQSGAAARTTAANSGAVESALERAKQQVAQSQPGKGHANKPAGGQPNDGNPLGNDTTALNAQQRGAIGDHVRECWTKDAGALDVDKQRVLLTVTTDAEGIVHRAEIAGEDVARMAEPRFRAFAERARRAILSPSCANLPLPGNALGRVNTLTFRFTP